MAAKKVDVSELLLQLKELKQKKACHMKRLKRKLGRAVVLKQPDVKEETINCDPRKTTFSKVGISEQRNALTELNHSDTISSSSKFIENEPTYANQLNCSSHIQVLNIESSFEQKVITHSQQLSKVQLLLSEDSVSKVTDSLKQDLNSEVLDSPIDGDPNCFKDQSMRHCQKRSAVELEIDNPTSNNSCLKKKIRISCEELLGDSESNPNYHLLLSKTADKDIIVNKNFDGPSEKFRTDVHPKCFDDKNNCDTSILISSKEDVEFDTSLLYKKSCSKKIEEQDAHTKIDSNSSLPNACKKVSKASSNFVLEKELDPNITEVADTEQLIESHYGEDRVNSQLNFESGITEVPETGQLIETQSKCVNNEVEQIQLFSDTQKMLEGETACLEDEREDDMIAINQKTHSCKVKSFKNKDNINHLVGETSREELEIVESSAKAHIFKEQLQGVLSDVAKIEEVITGNHNVHVTSVEETCGDFPTTIASFEEVTTENDQLDVIQSSPSRRLPCAINCSFTDDEENNSKLYDSDDLTNIFMRDGEMEDDSFEQIINLHSNQIDENGLGSFPKKDATTKSVEQKSHTCQDIYCKCRKQQEVDCVGSDIFTVPETELFDFASYNENKVDNIAQNISVTSSSHIDCHNTNSKIESGKKLKDENLENESNINITGGPIDIPNFLNSHKCSNADVTMNKLNMQDMKETILCSLNSVAEEDSTETEDFLRLSDYQAHYSSAEFKGYGHDESTQSQVSSLDFTCCLQSDIIEKVTQLKLSLFNNSQYLFIQHETWIQVWRKEEYCDWVKIFAHQVDDLLFQDLCLTQSENYLVLIMLLISDKNIHCLQFLVFERQSRLIKLMEHTHWFENSSTDDNRVFLCELGELRFATAEGRDLFKVHSHSFSCLEDSPRLLTVGLGSTTDSLHSLCRIDKLPNALLGVSTDMLYVWHHLEARLVTSVQLQIVDSLDIKNCTWATIENGLVFLMAICEEKESPKACYLLTTNLATGFCEIVSTFTLQPALNIEQLSSSKRINLAYCEPFIVAACEEGAFLWTVDEEYCCASLKAPDYSSVAIVPTLRNSFTIVVGCNGGCVNCYKLKCC